MTTRVDQAMALPGEDRRQLLLALSPAQQARALADMAPSLLALPQVWILPDELWKMIIAHLIGCAAELLALRLVCTKFARLVRETPGHVASCSTRRNRLLQVDRDTWEWTRCVAEMYPTSISAATNLTKLMSGVDKLDLSALDSHRASVAHVQAMADAFGKMAPRYVALRSDCRGVWAREVADIIDWQGVKLLAIDRVRLSMDLLTKMAGAPVERLMLLPFGNTVRPLAGNLLCRLAATLEQLIVFHPKPSVIDALRQLPHLTRLQIVDPRRPCDLSAVLRCPSLQCLSLRRGARPRSHSFDVAFHVGTTPCGITSLSLEDSSVTAFGLAAATSTQLLAPFRNLRALDFVNTCRPSVALFKAVAKHCPGLQLLGVHSPAAFSSKRGPLLTAKQATALVDQLPQLHTVMLPRWAFAWGREAPPTSRGSQYVALNILAQRLTRIVARGSSPTSVSQFYFSFESGDPDLSLSARAALQAGRELIGRLDLHSLLVL